MSAPTLHPNAGVASAAPGGRWLRALRTDWPRALCRVLDKSNSAVVRVAIAEIKGSAPRECGACMLVSREGIEGTIGGGHLEWEATRAARELLSDSGAPDARIWSLVLGPELSQCCGGAVKLWLERFTRADLPFLRNASRLVASGTPVVIATEFSASRVTRRIVRGDASAVGGSPPQGAQHGSPRIPKPGSQQSLQQARVHFSQAPTGDAFLVERLDVGAPALWLYGAGHVGQALVRAISDLPFEVTWVDQRAELLPGDLPDNIHVLNVSEPVGTVSSAPAGALFVVMTHDHALDYSLCREILGRSEFAWLGLIGSKSKGAKFRSRLARDGVTAELIERLVCPIGVGGVESKSPAAIAIAVAAQLLQTVEAAAAVGASCGERPVAAAVPNAAAVTAGPRSAVLPSTAPPQAVGVSCSTADCAQCSSHGDRPP